jgi:hypothetical protein
MPGPINNAEQKFRESTQRAITLRQNAVTARQRAQAAANNPILIHRSLLNRTLRRRNAKGRKNKNNAKTLRNNLQKAANKAEQNAVNAELAANGKRERWQNLRNAAQRKAAENRERSLRGPVPAYIPPVQQQPAYIPPVPGLKMTGINTARARGKITSPAAQALVEGLGLPQVGSIKEQLFGTTGHEPVDYLEIRGYRLGMPGMQQEDNEMLKLEALAQQSRDIDDDASGRSQKVRDAYMALGKKGLVPFYREYHSWRT